MQSVLGRKLPEEVTRAVESFYQDDEFTCQMPGKKDYVSIAKNVHVQKEIYFVKFERIACGI